tara:strand:+ start:164 stop:505 length:342 start_codon:yes stop_codon:yes gene_type:complete
MEFYRIRSVTSRPVIVVKEKVVKKADVEALGLTEAQFLEYLSDLEVDQSFEVSSVPEDSNFSYLNGMEVEDAITDLINESDGTVDDVEDWISGESDSELSYSIMQEGEELWRF